MIFQWNISNGSNIVTELCSKRKLLFEYYEFIWEKIWNNTIFLTRRLREIYSSSKINFHYFLTVRITVVSL